MNCRPGSSPRLQTNVHSNKHSSVDKMDVLQSADAPNSGPEQISPRKALKREAEENPTEAESAPKRTKLSDTSSNNEKTGELEEINKQINLLEQDFIHTIGVPEEYKRGQEIVSKIRELVEKIEHRTLSEKREQQLSALYAVDGLRDRMERIRASSGFKESKQLVKYIDLIQLNMKTAEKQGHRAQITQLATELRRVIQRIQEVQTRMQRLTLKVNLPRNEELFNQGHGEGCFVVVEEETKAHFDVNNAGGVFLGILLNSPVYKEWFHLEEGDPVLFCMKGQLRPVAFVDQTAMVDHLRALFAAERQQLEEKLESKNSPNIMEAVARDAEILRQQQPQIPSEVISGKE